MHEKGIEIPFNLGYLKDLHEVMHISPSSGFEAFTESLVETVRIQLPMSFTYGLPYSLPSAYYLGLNTLCGGSNFIQGFTCHACEDRFANSLTCNVETPFSCADGWYVYENECRLTSINYDVSEA